MIKLQELFLYFLNKKNIKSANLRKIHKMTIIEIKLKWSELNLLMECYVNSNDFKNELKNGAILFV